MKDDNKTEQKEDNNYMLEGMSLGMCFGCGIGWLIGTYLNESIMGMSFGLSIRMCLGMAIGAFIKKDVNDKK